MNIKTRDLFEKTIPKALAAKPKEFAEVGGTYTFDIAGEGAWTVDLDSETPHVSEPGSEAANVTISTTSECFQTMIDDPQMGMVFYFNGSLKVEGDPIYATRLQRLFALAV